MSDERLQLLAPRELGDQRDAPLRTPLMKSISPLIPRQAREKQAQGTSPVTGYNRRTRAVSSVGRAPARQAGGHWFEPSTAHLTEAPHWPGFLSGATLEHSSETSAWLQNGCCRGFARALERGLSPDFAAAVGWGAGGLRGTIARSATSGSSAQQAIERPPGRGDGRLARLFTECLRPSLHLRVTLSVLRLRRARVAENRRLRAFVESKARGRDDTILNVALGPELRDRCGYRPRGRSACFDRRGCFIIGRARCGLPIRQ
jgi:hypothetical protein